MANAKKLVIVESPSKAKTIGKFLGSTYKVVASVGHIRDLPKSKLGIDIEDNFEPQYINIRGKGDVIKELRKEAKKSSKIFLATDPDREGEAISWHIAKLLDIDETEDCRIVFNEITKTAIKEAVKKPRKIELNLVDAQQARRVLDRLVGYQISPLLWRKIRRGLSAGRVQSVALKIICDREEEIKKFVPEEYWNVDAIFSTDLKSKKLEGKKEVKLGKNDFLAKLTEHKGKKIKISDKKQADKVLEELSKGEYSVSKIDKKERKRKPYGPFTTSSLQQDSANKLGYTTKKTMMIAQQLYEGVSIKGHGTVGLVTYIRTDSFRISKEAKEKAKDFITSRFGSEYYSENFYANKKKDIQDAHEAIRPSRVELVPDEIKESLTKEQYNLYKLIWSRFVASQMSSALYDSVSADIENGDYTFKATGSKLKFSGFLKVYSDISKNDGDKLLPELEMKQNLFERKLEGKQNFTEPPSRYTEATLVKELEDKNIGRPSTYAPIIATLMDRKYTVREKKTLKPTDLGFLVTELMAQYFGEIVNVGFTANLEERLDDVEMQKEHWKKIIADFYKIFKDELEVAEKEIETVKIEDQLTGEMCEKCGKPLALKSGRFGDFIACTGYPECKNTKPIVKKINVKCPSCNKDIIARKGKKGKLFYGCSGYPDCTQVFWYKPTGEKCTECGSMMLEKKTKNTSKECSNPECGHKE